MRHVILPCQALPKIVSATRARGKARDFRPRARTLPAATSVGELEAHGPAVVVEAAVLDDQAGHLLQNICIAASGPSRI
jgi:hypothetical protein